MRWVRGPDAGDRRDVGCVSTGMSKSEGMEGGEDEGKKYEGVTNTDDRAASFG